MWRSGHLIRHNYLGSDFLFLIYLARGRSVVRPHLDALTLLYYLVFGLRDESRWPMLDEGNIYRSALALRHEC